MSKRVNINSINFDETDPTSAVRIHNSIEKYRFTLDETEHDHLLGGPGGAGHTSPLSNRADLPFSISAWVNLREAPLNKFNSIVTKWSQGVGSHGAKEFLFSIARTTVSGVPRTRLVFALYDDVSNTGTQNRYRSTLDHPLNQWVHIVATYGGNPDAENNVTDITVYQDGTELVHNVHGTYAISAAYEAMPAYNDSFSPLVIGNVNKYIKDGVHEEMPFRGKIADVCIFNKKLSASEAKEVYSQGIVKDMTQFSDLDSLTSWWKMGDDHDNQSPGTIVEYINGQHDGEIDGKAEIVTSAELPSEREKDENRTKFALNKARGSRAVNIVKGSQSFIHGGVSGDMPTATPAASTDGFEVSNAKNLHAFWKATAGVGKTHTVKAFGFNYASGKWSALKDIYGSPVELQTNNDSVQVYRLFEISGIDRVYFQQSGDALLSSDLFTAAVSSV